MMVTCAALALALANPASSGGQFTLTEDCPAPATPGLSPAALVVKQRFARPVVVEAGDHRVEGLAVLGGGNLIWRGGRIVAPGGQPGRTTVGPRFYAVHVARASGVTLENVQLTNARKAVVVDMSSDVTLRASRCTGLLEDCMIVANSRGLRFIDNQINDLQGFPTLCRRPGGDTPGLSRRQCEGDGGTWADGWHSDVLQLRDGVSDVLATGNRIVTTGHGMTQMDKQGDRPLAGVRLENNVIASGRHGLTLTSCDGCTIRGNSLTSAVPGWKSVIRPGQARACGNKAPDGGPGQDPCD